MASNLTHVSQSGPHLPREKKNPPLTNGLEEIKLLEILLRMLRVKLPE